MFELLAKGSNMLTLSSNSQAQHAPDQSDRNIGSVITLIVVAVLPILGERPSADVTEARCNCNGGICPWALMVLPP